MKLTHSVKSASYNVLILGLLLFLVLSGCNIYVDEKEGAVSTEPSQLSRDIIGTWILVGTPDEIGEPPESGGRFKFITDRHWVITHADPNTGEVIYHHGGTYTLKGDEYVESVDYASENTNYLINNSYKFKVAVEGDKLTQIGIGNDWNEVWKRAK